MSERANAVVDRVEWFEGMLLSPQHFQLLSGRLDSLVAWQTLAAYALEQKCLVDPFGIRIKTGLGHYFVTAEGVREAKKVTDFKAWIRDEMAESMRPFG